MHKLYEALSKVLLKRVDSSFIQFFYWDSITLWVEKNQQMQSLQRKKYIF